MKIPIDRIPAPRAIWSAGRTGDLIGATSVIGEMIPQSIGERRKVYLHDIADDVRVDSEVLMDKDIAEAPDLRPGNLRVRTGDALGRRFTASPMICRHHWGIGQAVAVAQSC